MSISKRTAVRLASATGGAIVLVALGVGVSLAATPPYQPGTSAGGDPANVGTLSFYNAAGTQIFGGSTASPVAAYVKTTGLSAIDGNNKAVMSYVAPTIGENPGLWNSTIASGSTVFPSASAAAPVKFFADPVVTTTTRDESLQQAFVQFPLDSNASDTDYYDMYEIRVTDGGTSGPDQNYASADILINTTTNAWSQVYPNQTQTIETVTPSTGAAPGTPITITSTTTPAADGSIQFFDGKTAVGAAQPVTSSNGTATVNTTSLAAGTHNIYAAFTPTAVTNGASTSPSQTVVVAAPAPALPEAPYALLLPLIGLGAVGAISIRRRARA